MTLCEIIGNLLAAFVVGLLACLTPKLNDWLEARTGKANYDQLMMLVTAFAQAAEQLYHDQDPNGAKRKLFVQEQVRALGVELTETVVNMIEGAVWEINAENRKALGQTKGADSKSAGKGSTERRNLP